MRNIPHLLRKCLVTVFFALNAHPLNAQDDAPLAMDEIQCQHLVSLDETELSFLLAWYDGYFNHMHGMTTLSDSSLSNLGVMIEDGCADAPERLILDLLNERIRQDALMLHP